MKLNSKLLLIILMVTLSNNLYCKTTKLVDNYTVTLTETGQGRTKDDAKYNALRNAIEKAFGAFISSNTTILNDNLIKDEIVSFSSGNIQNFKILSETQMPNGSYTSVVKATVSIGKLITFCESKGIVVEFKGQLFAANVKIKELEARNKERGIAVFNYNISEIIKKGIYNYTIEIEEPVKDRNLDLYEIKINVRAIFNDNFNNIEKLIGVTETAFDMNIYFPFIEQHYDELIKGSENFLISNGVTSLNYSEIYSRLKKNADNYNNYTGYSCANAAYMVGVRSASKRSVKNNSFEVNYVFLQMLTLDEISKITEYKINPINK